MSEKIDEISINTSSKKFDAIKKDAVTEESKKRLKELGIDSSTIKTETEAQQKIKEAQSSQANAPTSNVYIQHPIGEVVKEAKELAEKIGIKVGNIDNVEKFLDTIDKKIKDYEKQVEKDIDNERRDMVAGARNKYKKIKSEFEKSMSEQNKITSNLDMLANYNVVRS